MRARMAGVSSGSVVIQCVLAVVAVVAGPKTDGAEAELLVQLPRGEVGQPHLERRLVGASGDRDVEQGEQQLVADVASPPQRVDGEGRDMRLVDHQPVPAVGDDATVDLGDEVVREAVGLDLGAVGVWRPRAGEARLLDRLDIGQVVDAHRADREAHGRTGDHQTRASPPARPASAVTATASSGAATGRRAGG